MAAADRFQPRGIFDVGLGDLLGMPLLELGVSPGHHRFGVAHGCLALLLELLHLRFEDVLHPVLALLDQLLAVGERLAQRGTVLRGARARQLGQCDIRSDTGRQRDHDSDDRRSRPADDHSQPGGQPSRQEQEGPDEDVDPEELGEPEPCERHQLFVDLGAEVLKLDEGRFFDRGFVGFGRVGGFGRGGRSRRFDRRWRVGGRHGRGRLGRGRRELAAPLQDEVGRFLRQVKLTDLGRPVGVGTPAPFHTLVARPFEERQRLPPGLFLDLLGAPLVFFQLLVMLFLDCGIFFLCRLRIALKRLHHLCARRAYSASMASLSILNLAARWRASSR